MCVFSEYGNEHFLLKCSSYNEHRHLLFRLEILFCLRTIIIETIVNLMRLLYGLEKLKFHVSLLLLDHEFYRKNYTFLINLMR